MIKVERPLGGLGALRVVELPVERVLTERDDLTLVAVVLLHHGLHDPLTHGGLKQQGIKVMNFNQILVLLVLNKRTFPAALASTFS